MLARSPASINAEDASINAGDRGSLTSVHVTAMPTMIHQCRALHAVSDVVTGQVLSFEESQDYIERAWRPGAKTGPFCLFQLCLCLSEDRLGNLKSGTHACYLNFK
jgi:hypothetical protein